MSRRNLKFMRILFIVLVISSLTLGLLDLVHIKGQAIASIVLLSLLLLVELFSDKKS